MYKQVIVIRKDLKLSVGKTAAQVAHAAIGSIKAADKKIVRKWEKEGSKKVVLKANNLRELKEINKKAKALGLPCFLVRDAGLTEVAPGAVTALAIGPAEEGRIDKVTGKLKLL